MTKQQVYRLDKNENLFSHAPKIETLLNQPLSFPIISEYPEIHNHPLYDKLSSFLSLPPEYLFIGNGLENLIHLSWQSLIFKFNLTQIVLPQIHWTAYDEIANKVGFTKIVNYPTDPLTLNSNLDEFDSTVTNLNQPSLIVINNPSNPTAQEFDYSGLSTTLQKHPQHLFFLDEAYLGFGHQDWNSQQSLELVKNFKNVIVGRSFSKFFLSPGIRLGYLISQPTILQKLGLTPTYLGINQLTQLIGLTLINDYQFYCQNALEIKRIRDTSISQLNQSDLFFAYSSTTNFITVKVNSPTNLPELQKYLLERDFAIKTLTIFDKPHLRITVAPEAILTSLFSEMQAFFKE